MAEASEVPPSWAVVELMGHVRLAGRISEEEKFGAKIGRLDIPHEDGFITQYFGGSSVYRITIVSEEVARHVAAQCGQKEPVQAWEFPKQLKAAETSGSYIPPESLDYDEDDRGFDDQ